MRRRNKDVFFNFAGKKPANFTDHLFFVPYIVSCRLEPKQPLKVSTERGGGKTPLIITCDFTAFDQGRRRLEGFDVTFTARRPNHRLTKNMDNANLPRTR